MNEAGFGLESPIPTLEALWELVGYNYPLFIILRHK